MAKPARFALIFAPEAIEHLDRIESKEFGLLQRSIEEQLTYTPTEETRNRKPLEPPAPFAASWEIRCGPDITPARKSVGLSSLTVQPCQAGKPDLHEVRPCLGNNRFWVFYDVDLESREVRVLAIGIKDRNRLFIGDEEYEA